MSSDEPTLIPPPQNAPDRFEIGDLVLRGRYRIDAVLDGGMEADAYRGTRLSDEQPVFVKYQWRRKGKHRALILDRLLGCDHPGCVKLLDFDVLERPIEVYEWVDSTPLAALLGSSRTCTDGQVREIVRQLAEALNYLHRRIGTAHRDVKPSNLLVVQSDALLLKLADFGVMTLVDAGGATTFAGTKKYAPPEALRWSLPRDSDLMACDWWSLGRVVQELVDGIHPYDRIASTLGDNEPDTDAMEAVWGEVLSEHSRSKYGRAGQVEHSAAPWRPLLRGLLTTDREARWRYAQVGRWLAGEAVPDSYDASPYGAEAGAHGDAELIAEVRRLSTPEGWDEACRTVSESDGIVGRFRAMSDNKRVRARLRQADTVYDFLLKSAPATIAEEVLAMLVLRTIGGPTCPLTLRGYELDVDLLLEWARNDEPGTRSLMSALSTRELLGAIEALAPEVGQRLQAFANGWIATQAVLESWLPNEPLNRQIGLIARYSAQPRADNDRLIGEGPAVFASSKNQAVDGVLRAEERSDADAAALAFALAHAETFDFETVETVERRGQERERAKRAARDEERRHAVIAVAERRAGVQARNLRRASFALGGAGSGALLETLLWTGTASHWIAGLICVVGALTGAIVGIGADHEGCGGLVGGLLVGGIIGALLGTFVSDALQATIMGLGGPLGGAAVFAVGGAAIGWIVHEVRAPK
jgi:hypothetical protein